MKQLTTPLVVLVALAMASCNSSTTSTATVEDSRVATDAAAPAEQPTTTAGATATTGDKSTPAAGDSQGTPSATPLKDFEDRIEKYVSIRKSADDHTPPLKKTEKPGEISTAQDALGQRIRDLRADAKRGDIFTPEISAYFRRLLQPEAKLTSTKESIQEDNPGAFPFKINDQYPEKEPRSTVPPNVLMTLPVLPEDIEYRFVAKHMILLDGRANLIIDYIPNAIP